MDDNKVSTSFTINDGVSGALKNMTSAIKDLMSHMDKLGKTLENLDDTSLDNLENSVGDVGSKLDEATKSAKDTTSEVTSLNKSNLNQLDSGLDKIAKSTTDLAGQAVKADSAIDSLSKDNLSGLNNELSKAESNLNSIASGASKADSKIKSFDNSKIDKISTSAKDAKSDIGKIPEELNKVKTAADEASESVNSIGEGIDTGGIGDTLSSIGSSAKIGAFSSMLDIAGQVVEKVKEIAGASMEAAGKMDSLRNSFSVGLGASAEETAKYMSEAQETFAAGYGESLDEVATQMTYIKQTMGNLVDDSQLSDLTAEFMTLDQSGMDFNETVRGVKNLMVNFGIDSQSALDLMAAGMQNGLNASDELGDNIAEYSGRWAQAGVSASEYFSMLDAGVQNGAYNLDKVGDFLNEFLTSMSDGRLEENLGSFSSQTQSLFQQWQNGSATQKQVFDSVISDLNNMSSETERATLASTVWSSLGEDNAMSMILALGGVVDKYGDIDGAASQATENNSSAVSELSNRWELFKTNTLAPVGNALAEMGIGLLDAVDSIGPFFDDCGKHINDFLTGAIQGLENFGGWLGQKIDDIKNWFSTLGNDIVTGLQSGINGALGGLKDFWNNNVIGWLPDSMKEKLKINSPSLVFQDDIGLNIVAGLQQGISQAWEGLKTVANNLWQDFLSIFNGGQEENDKQIVDYSSQIEQTKTQLAELQTQVSTGYDTILATVQEKNTLIVESGIGMFSTMTQTVITDAQNMVNGIAVVFNQIPVVVQTSFGAALPVAQESLTAINTMANEQISQLVVRSQNALFEIIPAFNTVLDGLKTMMLSTLDSMNNGIITVTTAFGNMYVGIFQSTFDRVIALYSVFQTRAVTATNNLISAIDRTLDSNLPKVFNDAATNAINSFIDGIASRISEATAVTDKLVEAVKGAFVKGLGIHSPSDKTYWYGQMTGLGFIEGLSDSQLVEFAKSVLTDIVNAFNDNRFNAGELVAYLGDDTQKVINYYNENPDLLQNLDTGSQTIAYPLQGGPWPITSNFGPRWGRNHDGTDIGAAYGTPILSALPGNVSVSQSGYYGYGTAVKVDTPPYEFVYGHMASTAVNVGQQVQKGQVIGYVDSTGNSTGDHLHFETRLNGEPFDNASLLAGATINAQSGVVAAIQSAYEQYKAMQYLKQYGLMGDAIPASLYEGTSAGLLPFNYTAPANVARWAPQVLTALAMLGQPAGLLNGILWGIESESSGDPGATYLGDINAREGGSKGLLQTIPSTFSVYRNPNLPNDITDPLANIYSCLNYMIGRYGSIQNVINERIRKGHWEGYAVGTRYVPEDMLAMIHKGEAIIPANQNPYRDSGGDYLTEIAQRVVNDAPDISLQNLAGEVVPTYSGGNSDVTINLSFGDINNQGDLDNAKEEIIRTIELGLSSAMNGKGSVDHAY